MFKKPSLEHLPYPWNSRVAMEQALVRSAEELGPAPCPVCRHRLVVRLGSRGPYFHCGCRVRGKEMRRAA